jgi:hypothetical protein
MRATASSGSPVWGREAGSRALWRAADVMTLRNGKVVRHVGYPDASGASKLWGCGSSGLAGVGVLLI